MMILVILVNLVFTYHIVGYKFMKYTQQQMVRSGVPGTQLTMTKGVIDKLDGEIQSLSERLLVIEETVESLTSADD